MEGRPRALGGSLAHRSAAGRFRTRLAALLSTRTFQGGAGFILKGHERLGASSCKLALLAVGHVRLMEGWRVSKIRARARAYLLAF